MTPLEVPVDVGRDEARERAVEELAKAKYGGMPPWVEDGLDRLGRLVERIVEPVLSWQPDRGAGVNPGFVLVVVLLVVAIAGVVWRVGVPRWQTRSRDVAVGAVSTRTPEDYRASAEAYAAAADWRRAVAERFRAVVRELETTTVLDVRPARTAWEAAAVAARTLPAAHDALFLGADAFNAVSYGDAVPTADTYGQLVWVDDEVTRAARTVDLAAEADVAAAPR